MKKVEELKNKRTAAREAGDQEKVRRLNDRANEVFEDEYVPLAHRVERQQALIDDPPVWKPMPDT